MSSSCLFLLSDKSSGSSIFQRELERHPDVHTLPHTPHHEQETLYWIKASAALGLPQVPFVRSVLPYAQAEGRRLLEEMLTENLGARTQVESEHDAFEGWRRLCERYGPVLFEKSPHHLHQWSSLELMARCWTEIPEVTFHYIGLVRNPLDTLYSMWSRWRVRPEQAQYEWLRAYRNLQRFQDLVGDRLLVVRYEDLAEDPERLAEVFSFIGLEPPTDVGGRIHRRAVQKWRDDARFGFVLDGEVARLAEAYGYALDEVRNEPRRWWPIFREGGVLLHAGKRQAFRLRRAI